MAFEEIKAKLGLDISDFEKGMLDANRAAKQAADAQMKLANFRRNKALEEATDLEKIKILQGELVQLYNLRKTAIAGSAPYLNTQLEIEKKMVEIGKARVAQKQAEANTQKQIEASVQRQSKSYAGGRSSSKLSGVAGSVAAGAAGGFLSRNAPKALGLLKNVGSKLGLGGVLAGLFPEVAGITSAATGAAGAGAGVAAGGAAVAAGPAVALSVAIAGIVYGYKKINEYFDNIAERAKQIKQLITESGQRTRETLLKSLDKDPKKKLKFLQDEADQAKSNYLLAFAISRNEEGDLKTLEAKAELEKANIALADHKASMQESAANDAANEAEGVKAINDQRSAALSEEIKKREGVKYLQMQVAEAEKEANKQGLTKLQKAQALLALDKAKEELNNKIEDDKKAAAEAAAEKDRQSKQSAERIKNLIEEVAQAELKVLDAGDDQNAAAKAQIELQKARKKLSEEQAKITEKTAGLSDIVNDAEKKRAKEISDKIDALFSRASSLDKALAESKRQAELPTMADVLSGKRDLGSKPRQDIKKLSEEEAAIKRLSDKESRLKDQFYAAKTEGDRKNILEEGRQNRQQLAATRARRDALLAGLTGKVSDVPFADQEEAAKQARNAAEKAAADNKSAQPIVAPEPIVAPQPIIPAQQALYSAQDQMKKAQNQIGVSSKSESGNISGVLNDIKTGINDLNKKLGPSSIK
jgi:hypothetical protein